MFHQSRRPVPELTRSDWLLAGIDVCLVATCWVVALVLRYDAQVPPHAWDGLIGFLPLAVLVAAVVNSAHGLYSGVWRHAGVYEARHVLAAQGTGLIVVIPAVFVMDRPVPLSVPLIAATLAVGLLGAVRFQSRLFALHRRNSYAEERILIIGAGSAGADLARDVEKRDRRTRIVGFLDDDPRLHGRRVHGVLVHGPVTELVPVAQLVRATCAVLAVPSASHELTRRTLALAEQSGLVMRVVPPLSELAQGSVSLRDVRDIDIGDLLGRGQIDTDLSDVVALIRGKRVLVTGAGGSIGSEIARQVVRLEAETVILVDHDETHLFDIAAELPPSTVQRLIDIRDLSSVEQVFRTERPDIVFHAAAHKHVPLLEDHPVEAVRTNVLGTRNVVLSAVGSGVQRFVLISTDKAVSPQNVMGATKRVAENIVLRESQGMRACAVRFGNVLGSRGSVVPTFMQQIRGGGPITVTDPRMTRYFMSIPEAVRLVLHAAALSDGAEIFMLDMGEPVRILDLAHKMIRLSGLRPGLDVEIRTTGVRPGEKLTERLRTVNESPEPTSHPSIVRLVTDLLPSARLEQGLATLESLAIARDDKTARSILMELVSDSSTVSLPAQRRTEPQRLAVGGQAWT